MTESFWGHFRECATFEPTKTDPLDLLDSVNVLCQGIVLWKDLKKSRKTRLGPVR